MCLNPFEVREVLQAICHSCLKKSCRLNPFEVREVLQDIAELELSKSDGLNPFEVREVLQGLCWRCRNAQKVSIPLKSGRCCKMIKMLDYKIRKSQSL